MSDYEKSSVVTYPFYFINRQSIHKTNCMQRIKKILMREVFSAIALGTPLTVTLMYCCLPTELQSKLSKMLKVTYILMIIFYATPMIPLYNGFYYYFPSIGDFDLRRIKDQTIQNYST